jgi:hypothetical protein
MDRTTASPATAFSKAEGGGIRKPAAVEINDWDQDGDEFESELGQGNILQGLFGVSAEVVVKKNAPGIVWESAGVAVKKHA